MNGQDITGQVPSGTFNWKRNSGNATADAAWNAAHTAMREIDLTAGDITGNSVTISCTALGTAGVYGTVGVNLRTMIPSHTPGDLDGRFSLTDGELILTTSDAPEPDDAGMAVHETAEAGLAEVELVKPEMVEPDLVEPDLAENKPMEHVDITGQDMWNSAPDSMNSALNNLPDSTAAEADDPDDDLSSGMPADYDLTDGVLSVDVDAFAQMTATATLYAVQPELDVTYDYDANGLRVRKTVKNGAATTTTDYILHGKLVVHQTVKQIAADQTETTHQLHFFYDKDSRSALFEHTDATGVKTLYYYVQNLQGDIVEIVDTAGTPMVQYSYDAWGKPKENTSTLTTAQRVLYDLNPFRYRGYVWDAETGLYYLRSRYYNPTWGRFLNADVVLGKVGKLLNHSLYAYCWNDPINSMDSNGNEREKIYLYYNSQGEYIEFVRYWKLNESQLNRI